MVDVRQFVETLCRFTGVS